MPKKPLTLCIIYQSPKILLGFKKRGFGSNRWNGFGGKLEPGETPEEAAKREIQEESGIRVSDLEEVGVIDFEFTSNPEILEVHIFKAEHFEGRPQETEEMRPEWFEIDKIPFSQMWPDDQYWLPLFLAGKKFNGKFVFGKDDKILNYELKETS